MPEPPAYLQKQWHLDDYGVERHPKEPLHNVCGGDGTNLEEMRGDDRLNGVFQLDKRQNNNQRHRNDEAHNHGGAGPRESNAAKIKREEEERSKGYDEDGAWLLGVN